MNLLIKVLDFIYYNIYSTYLVVLFIGSGLLAFFLDTSYVHLNNYNKDFVISFFWGVLNIVLGILLILINSFYENIIF